MQAWWREIGVVRKDDPPISLQSHSLRARARSSTSRDSTTEIIRMANTPAASKPTRTLDLPALESWLWEAACVIRGPVDAPKFKDYILPLIFLKRLSDVFDDELTHLTRELGGTENAAKLVDQDHKLVR